MSEYRAPLEDIRFVLEHVAGLSELAELPGYEHAEPDVVAGLLEEAGKFMSEVLSPLIRVEAALLGFCHRSESQGTVQFERRLIVGNNAQPERVDPVGRGTLHQ